ncbi:UNVERIFIED_CONTAM: AAA family ATPase, partial [Bacteroidetes bacterium 56_B9]
MTNIYPGQYRISRIQLINWGTFHGYFSIPVARKGFLITGGSGSGKSTLLDAMS